MNIIRSACLVFEILMKIQSTLNFYSRNLETSRTRTKIEGENARKSIKRGIDKFIAKSTEGNRGKSKHEDR